MNNNNNNVDELNNNVDHDNKQKYKQVMVDIVKPNLFRMMNVVFNNDDDDEPVIDDDDDKKQITNKFDILVQWIKDTVDDDDACIWDKLEELGVDSKGNDIIYPNYTMFY